MSQLSEDRFDRLVADERNREHPPLNDWETIAARAREEGLIYHGRQTRWSAGRGWMQAAAAVVLLVGGVAIGRATTALPTTSDASSVATAEPVAISPDASPASRQGAPSFSSVEEAWTTLNRAGAEYQRASAFIAADNAASETTRDSASIYRARLAALEQLMSATQTARAIAPRDPVINQYYLATMGAREATQQLVARPAGLRLNGF